VFLIIVATAFIVQTIGTNYYLRTNQSKQREAMTRIIDRHITQMQEPESDPHKVYVSTTRAITCFEVLEELNLEPSLDDVMCGKSHEIYEQLKQRRDQFKKLCSL